MPLFADALFWSFQNSAKDLKQSIAEHVDWLSHLTERVETLQMNTSVFVQVRNTSHICCAWHSDMPAQRLATVKHALVPIISRLYWYGKHFFVTRISKLCFDILEISIPIQNIH